MTAPPGVSVKAFEAAIKKCRDAYSSLCGKYWTRTGFMGECESVYSRNNHSLMRSNETIKDAIDLNGILSAGRCGIRPKHECEKREDMK